MANFIKWEGTTGNLALVCSHPSVERVWQTGVDTRRYESDQPQFITQTHLLMKDGSRKDFKDEKESFDKANEYLNTLT